ncbi:hypothetical protein C2G38_2045978 [Gigaspora rosea]|uniref:Serine-threonine/tyrosine-protein kinase catalytic domain-containing protein n=1 Tax=Gigaspora rosea TaxID=44941 RepID=A0A397UE85_9GLOM|nr:hypothetical protein C2G38_2045978 [Gigaspora rosea]
MVDSEEWLKNAIDEGYIRSYDYSEFSVHKPIDKGVSEFYTKQNGKITALQKYSSSWLIADFGLSKNEASKTSNASVHGMQVYIDPQCFENVSYKRSKKSHWGNSLGNFKWQIAIPITKPLWHYYSYIQRKRKISLEGTPDSYIQLYKRCWNYDSNQRPELEEISRKLMDLSDNEYFGIV